MLIHRRRRRTNIQRHLTTTITALSHLIAQNTLVARLLILLDYVLKKEQRRPQGPFEFELVRRRAPGNWFVRNVAHRRRREAFSRGLAAGADVHARGAVGYESLALGVVVAVAAAVRLLEDGFGTAMVLELGTSPAVDGVDGQGGFASAISTCRG